MKPTSGQTLPTIEIDPGSGFCFGVTSAISKAETELSKDHTLYCLGDIVHNSDEVERLQKKGLITISHADLQRLKDQKVLLRAHGEPPLTYSMAKEKNIQIIDATCPVVLQLQRRIKDTYNQPSPPQIVIYGKSGHAEVNGLVGQTNGSAIVIESADQLDAIDFSKPIAVYSQTTKELDRYRDICRIIRQRSVNPDMVQCHDTICRRVANRVPAIIEFASTHDLLLFVAGKKSSNGRVLFDQAKNANPRSHLISNASEIDSDWFDSAEIKSIGIAGATSTPRWLMEEVMEHLQNMFNHD